MLSELLNIQVWDSRERSRLERAIWRVPDIVHTENPETREEAQVKTRRWLMRLLRHCRIERLSRERRLHTQHPKKADSEVGATLREHKKPREGEC